MVPTTNYELFFEEISRAKNIAAITGAGLSDVSFISSFRDSRLYWRRYKATNLMSPEAFKQCPGLVWEFHHYRREAAFNALPNKAHLALARYANNCSCADEDDDDDNEKRRFTVITQNVDGLHQAAGSEHVIELLGNVKKTICTNCQAVEVNVDRPICEALRGREFPPMKGRVSSKIPIKSLPKCRFCEQLLRPHLTWFGEDFDKAVFDRTRDLLEECDFCLLIGVSPVDYPASTVATLLAQNGIPVAEFNTTEWPSDQAFTYFFPGPYESTIPLALKMTHCSCN